MLNQNDKETAKLLLQAFLADGLPPMPGNRGDALKQNEKISLCLAYMEEITNTMLERDGKNRRVIRGEAQFDERIRADQGREMAKLDAAMTNTDSYAEWNRQQGILNAQKDAELQQANKRQMEAREKAQEQILQQIGYRR